MANVKITELPEVVTVDPAADVTALVSGGITTQATPQDLVNAVLASGIEGSTAAGTALVRITQTGAGYSLLVEDEANPDSTPTVIHASGAISVGNTIDAGANNVYVSGNVAANIASLLTELLVIRSGGGEVMRLRGDSNVGSYPVLTVNVNEAASLVSINIGTVDTTTVGSLSFTGQGTTRWSMTTTGDFFPRQGSVGMKEGFMFVPGGSGAPTDVPTNENAGITPLYFDETNNRLYAYNGGWKYTQLA